MITNAQIKYMAGAGVYARGESVYLEGKVLDMDVHVAQVMRS